MSKLATRSELDKLAETLAVEPEQLEFLEVVPADELRALRGALHERLFEIDATALRRVAAIAARLPVSLVVPAVGRAGPLVTARLAAELPAAYAAAVAERLPTTVWADACAHLDPRRTREMIERFPLDQLVAVALELAGRRDYMTMSRFVDFISDDALRAVEDAIEDEGTLLMVAFYMGSKNRLDRLFRMLPRERLEALLLQVEERSDELLFPLLSLLVHSSFGLKRELAELAAAQDEAVLNGYVRGAHEQGLWTDLLPVVAAMSETARRRVVNLPILREHEVQASILDAADEAGLWGIVLPMIALMDAANRDAVAELAAAAPDDRLEAMVDAALMGEHWETLLDLVTRMPERKQQAFAASVARLGEVDPDLRSRIADGAVALGFGAAFTTHGAPTVGPAP